MIGYLLTDPKIPFLWFPSFDDGRILACCRRLRPSRHSRNSILLTNMDAVSNQTQDPFIDGSYYTWAL